MPTILCKYPDGNEAYVSVENYPDTCPFCGKGVEFKNCHTFIDSHRGNLQIVFQCPRNDCRKFVMGLYQFSHAERVGYPDSYEEDIYALHELLPPKPISKRDFAPELREISPTFVEIYNQAYATEQLGLEQICGVGYRKALEFLVKDFACLENPGATEHIKNMFLGNCIRDYISDARIQGCAKRTKRVKR